MIENYVIYLKFISEKINKFFERQKPYIFCQKGCGMCCKNAQFPYSKIETDYLMIGAWRLPRETKKLVAQNVKRIAKEKKEFKGKPEDFKYDCPFLIDNVCSVYEHRGIICRTFGLMYVGADDRVKIPFCSFKGFNYSNVIEDSSGKISAEKFKKLGVEEVPAAFNLNYQFLTDADFEHGFNFQFGEKKPLIDWFIDEDKTNESTQRNLQIS